MATATTPETRNPFSTVFSGNVPKQQQIQDAVELLLQMLDRPQNPPLAQAWGQTLQGLTGEQLAAAFHTAAITVRGWPSLADILTPIFDEEYLHDWQWLVRNLEIHGTLWLERPAIYAERWRRPGAGIDEWEQGAVITPAIPAPKIPERIVRALQIVGGGTVLDGLSFVARHPGCHGQGPRLQDPLDVTREKFHVEREFRGAWLIVRRRELRGN
jgi:hypothetical protein